jgi:hypothetical protein
MSSDHINPLAACSRLDCDKTNLNTVTPLLRRQLDSERPVSFSLMAALAWHGRRLGSESTTRILNHLRQEAGGGQ